MKKIFFAVLALSALFVLYACGGSGGSSGSSSSGNTVTTYTISGTVLSGSSGFAGVTINLSGGKTASTTTDASGNYSFTVPNGSYTVTPVKTNYTFTPSSRAVTVNNVDSTGNHFAAAAVPATYTLSGNVSLSGGGALQGVTVTLGGDNSGTTTTDGSGNYSFTTANGSYTVTPSMTNYTFTPSSRTVTVNSADSAGNDFAAAAVPGTYTLSGAVTLPGSVALQGVTVTLEGAGPVTATTDASGIYSFIVSNGSYTVTPSLSGYIFDPANIVVTVSSADSAGNNFTAYSTGSFSISGTITNANPAGSGDITVCAYDMINFLNAGCTPVASGGGAYTLTGLPTGQYRISATQDVNGNGMMEIGETYGQYTSPVTVNNSDVTGIDIAVTPVYGMSGTITNNNPATGPVVVCAYDAATLFGNCASADAGTGMYTIPVIDGNYTVSAWQDANSNFQADSGEPYGDYTTSPPHPTVVTVSGSSVAGIDITIQ